MPVDLKEQRARCVAVDAAHEYAIAGACCPIDRCSVDVKAHVHRSALPAGYDGVVGLGDLEAEASAFQHNLPAWTDLAGEEGGRILVKVGEVDGRLLRCARWAGDHCSGGRDRGGVHVRAEPGGSVAEHDGQRSGE